MRNRSDKITAFLMILPSIVLLAIFVYYFIGETIYISMSQWGERDPDLYPPMAEHPDKGFPQFESITDFLEVPDDPVCEERGALETNPECASYRDLTNNYEKLMTSGLEVRFRASMVNTFFFTLFFLAGCVTAGFFLALLLDQRIVGEGVFRTIFLMPMALSFIVTGTIWRWLLQPNGGINILPEKLFGLERLSYAWINSTETVLEFSWSDIPLYLTYIGLAMLGFVGFNYISQENDRIGIAVRMALQFILVAIATTLIYALAAGYSQTALVVGVIVGAGWVVFQLAVNNEAAAAQNYVPRNWRPVLYFGAAAAVLVILYLAGFWDKIFLPLSNPKETKGYNAALSGIIIAAIWQMSGYTMAMFLAGIRGIPEELREAARVDGCTEIGVYRTIIIPMMRPVILSALIVLGHISLKIFDLVWAMSGPDNAKTVVPGILVYTSGFRSNRFAIGGSIAVIMLFLVGLVIIPYLWNTMRQEVRK